MQSCFVLILLADALSNSIGDSPKDVEYISPNGKRMDRWLKKQIVGLKGLPRRPYCGPVGVKWKLLGYKCKILGLLAAPVGLIAAPYP